MTTVIRSLFLSVLVLCALAPQLHAQDEPDPMATARTRIGPVAINPTVNLTNIGVDSNVFNSVSNPQSDFTFTVDPYTEVWLKLWRGRLGAKSRNDLVWYQKFRSERSVNNTYGVEFRLPLNRMSFTVSGDWIDTRARGGSEIDSRAHHKDRNISAAANLKFFTKTYLVLSASRATTGYQADQIFEGADLGLQLNRTSTNYGIAIRNRLTPMTTVAVTVERSEDRFTSSPERNSHSTQLNIGADFDRSALIQGHVAIGYRNYKSQSSAAPGYSGLTTATDLTYTLLGATKFNVLARRDVAYSYDQFEPLYIDSGITGSITQQLFWRIDAVARYQYQALAYHQLEGLDLLPRTDHVSSYGASLGVRITKTLRLAINGDDVRRSSIVPGRSYHALRFGTSVTTVIF